MAIQKIILTKSCFFYKIDKPLASLTMENGSILKGKIAAGSAKIQGLIKYYYERLYAVMLNNLDEMTYI